MKVEEKTVQCPYCWEYFSLLIDPSEGESQTFVYDCEVCCRPIDMSVKISGEKIKVKTKSGGEI